MLYFLQGNRDNAIKSLQKNMTKPYKTDHAQEDLFLSRLSTQLNPRHPLMQLAQVIPWDAVEKRFSGLFSNGCGQPPKPVRLMVGLLMLSHMDGLSDEATIEHWVENPYWQFFCGFDFLQWEAPIDPSSMVRWRKRLGKEGMEWILSLTVQVAVAVEVVKPKSLEKVIVDTTVMEKNVQFPTDSKLLHKAIQQCVKEARQDGIMLRQSYKHVSKKAMVAASRYAHAKQMKRCHREVRRLKVYLGRVVRDIERKCTELMSTPGLSRLIEISKRLIAQERKSPNKVYSMHEAEAVRCITKGKARHPYEFGCKAAMTVTHKEGLVVSAMAVSGSMHDNNTLRASLELAHRLTGREVKDCFVDRGYRGHGIRESRIWLSGQKRGVTPSLRRHIKRRSMIEPMIGHMKSEGRLRRNPLKGILGDEIHAVLCGIGHNLRMLKAFCSFFWFFLLQIFMTLILKNPRSYSKEIAHC